MFLFLKFSLPRNFRCLEFLNSTWSGILILDNQTIDKNSHEQFTNIPFDEHQWLFICWDIVSNGYRTNSRTLKAMVISYNLYASTICKKAAKSLLRFFCFNRGTIMYFSTLLHTNLIFYFNISSLFQRYQTRILPIHFCFLWKLYLKL